MDISIYISIISIMIAGLSVYFARSASKSSQKAAIANLLFKLNEQYLELSSSGAIKITWDEYRKILKEQTKESNKKVEELTKIGAVISSSLARKYNSKTLTGEIDENITNAVNKTFWFWHHLALLVKNNLISEDLALTSFGDPEILGFLHPIDKDWIQYTTINKLHQDYLGKLYRRWQKKVR